MTECEAQDKSTCRHSELEEKKEQGAKQQREKKEEQEGPEAQEVADRDGQRREKKS